MTIALEHGHEQPEFLEFYERVNRKGGESTLYNTTPMIGKTQTLSAYGNITVYYSNLDDKRIIEYEVIGRQVFIDGQQCIDTPLYIHEPDYLYMVQPYRSFEEFKEQFDKNQYYRKWKTPVIIEPTKMVRHFEIYFGKSACDIYVLFNGNVYSEPKKDFYGDIIGMDIGWSVKLRVSDTSLDDSRALVENCKKPILLTDVPTREPEPEPDSVVIDSAELREQEYCTIPELKPPVKDNWTLKPPFYSRTYGMLDSM